jgi:hypothetical protein
MKEDTSQGHIHYFTLQDHPADVNRFIWLRLEVAGPCEHYNET